MQFAEREAGSRHRQSRSSHVKGIWKVGVVGLAVVAVGAAGIVSLSSPAAASATITVYKAPT